jgi:hypothetical protein
MGTLPSGWLPHGSVGRDPRGLQELHLMLVVS